MHICVPKDIQSYTHIIKLSFLTLNHGIYKKHMKLFMCRETVNTGKFYNPLYLIIILLIFSVEKILLHFFYFISWSLWRDLSLLRLY